jgi:ABC-type Fe3+ transport system substrate-binding protein
LYSASTNGSIYEGTGVAAITAGTDNSGYLLLDMLFTNGNVSEAQGGGWFTPLNTNATAIGKAHGGVLDVIFQGGNAYTENYYIPNTLNFLTNAATTAA